MPEITYRLPDGSERVVDVPVGITIMDGSVRNNLPGIVAECGGGCSCATCHVHLDEEWLDHFDAPTDEELDLLEYSEQFCPRSRLACQLVVSERSGGVVVTIPPGNGE
ncbi:MULTISPECIES: 2Fe-2S iron-sulfur cluster-binding protein [Nocardia]|uniref:2Fe-2S iron-sulfur cluster-binding protein n=1 Tax=Nocardia TaxID=1817 RepID=UPI0002E11FA9|nr:MULTISPECIES: 2Fe-2S iron-sulfur cluster-binding protein [Nocardia]